MGMEAKSTSTVVPRGTKSDNTSETLTSDGLATESVEKQRESQPGVCKQNEHNSSQIKTINVAPANEHSDEKHFKRQPSDLSISHDGNIQAPVIIHVPSNLNVQGPLPSKSSLTGHLPHSQKHAWDGQTNTPNVTVDCGEYIPNRDDFAKVQCHLLAVNAAANSEQRRDSVLGSDPSDSSQDQGIADCQRSISSSPHSEDVYIDDETQYNCQIERSQRNTRCICGNYDVFTNPSSKDVKTRKYGTVSRPPQPAIIAMRSFAIHPGDETTDLASSGPQDGQHVIEVDPLDSNSTDAQRTVDEGKTGSRWSIKYLKKLFREMDIHEVYERYWLRHQRRLFYKLLILLSIYCTLVIFLYNALADIPDSSYRRRITLFYLCATVVMVLLACLAYNQRVFARSWLILAISTWVLLNLLIFLTIPLQHGQITPYDRVPMVFFVIFIVHTMLPLPRRLAVLLGATTGVLDLIVLIFFSNEDDLIKYVFANTLIYVCSGLTGLYHMHLTDVCHRHTFLDTRMFIEADMKTSVERERLTQLREVLLLKVIPGYLLEDMKQALNKELKNQERSTSLVRRDVVTRMPRQIFHDLLVDKHDNVSILYADIVNFTVLTVQLEPAELVKTLNQLFGRFDELAKANECLRIKMLGDSYYCVSGLPDPIPDHARNCVIMGLQMILVIRNVRRETGVEHLNMRIGVHSGLVLSGVLGLKKWQYDIWSTDVDIANRMESAGIPGKVHITEDTLKFLNGEFSVDQGYGEKRNSWLKEMKMKTFFISDNEIDNIDMRNIIPHTYRVDDAPEEENEVATIAEQTRVTAVHLMRSVSIVDYMDGWGAETPFHSLSGYMLESTLPEKIEVNRRLERAFHLQRSSSQDETGDYLQQSVDAINVFTLRYNQPELESQYAYQYDTIFRFYVLCAFLIFAFMIGVQIILLEWTVMLYVTILVGTAIFCVLIVLTTGLTCLPGFSKLPVAGKRHLGALSRILVTDMRLKILLSFVSACVIYVASLIPASDCQWSNAAFNLTENNAFAVRDVEMAVTLPTQSPFNSAIKEVVDEDVYPSESYAFTFLPMVNRSFLNMTEMDVVDELAPCLFAPYYLSCCMLALISCSVYLRISYMVKMSYMLFGLIIFNIMFYNVFNKIFTIYDAYNQTSFIPTNVLGTMYTAILFVALFILDRQIETSMRWDFLCKAQMKEATEELQNNATLNEQLLGNMLPRHVVEHFTRGHGQNRHELYHQYCRNACVMFAAIPNFNAFFTETVNVTGPECLRVLNEIISLFDRMLSRTDFYSVEKIKTIGSTYMAAVGLSNHQDDTQDDARTAANLLLIVKFAWAMMEKLEELSQDVFYDYQLRIGINHGDVVAGVVGATKPQYDVWGDTVNVASRMETNGVMGRIQIRQETANMLTKEGVSCEYRSEMTIKGKGQMRVYLVSAQAQNKL